MPAAYQTNNMLRRHPFLILLGVLAILLVILHLVLPHVVKNYVNDKLHALHGYDGSIEDVDIQLWRGAYRVDGLRIVKKGAGQATPFFSSDHIDFSVEWRSLLHGSLVAEGVFEHPNLNLVQAEDKSKSQLGKEQDWAEPLRALSPFRFNSVGVHDGRITFKAPGIAQKDAITANHVNGEIVNLTNVSKSGNVAFADFHASAQVLDNAPLNVQGTVDPLARQPTFDINLSLTKVQLPQVNPWLREYIKADAASGRFELYLEAAAADGKFKGYAKPLMQDVKISSPADADKGPLRRLWEGILNVAVTALENPQQDQVAARLPFSGSFDDPKVGIIETIISVLKNGFVSAFAHSLEGSISLRDVKNNLRDADEKKSDKKQ